MTSPDAAQDKAHDAANAIAGHVSTLWMEAHAQGMRTGIECAALHLDTCVEEIRKVAPEAVVLVELIRDQVRLMAFEVPDPEVPDGSR